MLHLKRTILAKLIMQETWNLKLDWDDEVPSSIKDRWNQFRTELPMLSKITIDRWIQYDQEDEIQLHGFCDASEKAYAAAVYTRITKGDKVEIRLVASKTRVNKNKNHITKVGVMWSSATKQLIKSN